MYSRRKAFSKSRRDCFVSDGSSSQFNDAVPKVEFEISSVDPEDEEAYWEVHGGAKPPRPGIWNPPPFRANNVRGCPSKSCPNGLAATWSFCRVPESVEFCLPEAGEVARSPPEGYFTCFEAYLMQCHMWFPIPEVIAKLLNFLRLSIGQIYMCGLQHIVGIFVLSYELGVTVDVSHLEAMLRPCGNSTMVQLKPHPTMAIIIKFYSNYHSWKDHFFFVRVDDASVEASGIPFLPTVWGQKRASNRALV
ncbi:hypothetical protein Bca4012_065285 [Brassica carinata]